MITNMIGFGGVGGVVVDTWHRETFFEGPLDHAHQPEAKEPKLERG
jgi:hypothetical protein